LVKISVVTAGRDPDYGENLMDRTKVAYERNMMEASSRNIEVDWVFVEWNPTKVLISTWLSDQGVRCFIVPTDIHERLVHPKVIGEYRFMEGHAKNVGMRRAEHEWMIVSNVDNLYNPSIWNFVEQGKFDPTVMYRAERRDVPFKFFNKQFPKMERNKIRVYNITNKLRHAAGDFMMLSASTNPGYNEEMNDTNVRSDGHFCHNWTFHLKYSMEQIGRVYKASHPLIMRSMRKKKISHKGFRRSRVVEEGAHYINPSFWGLIYCPEIQLSNNIWELQWPSQ